MKLADGTVISRAEVSPYKFGGDPMAEYLWCLSMDTSFPDQMTGDAIDWHYHVSRFGKRLLFCNTQGFVWVDKYDTEEQAVQVFESIDSDYGTYEDDDE